MTWRRLRMGFGLKPTWDTTSRWSDGTLVAGMEIAPLDSRTAPAGSGTPTTGDSPLSAVCVPIALLATTRRRILWFTSAEPRRYVLPFPTARQLAPAVSQRSQL